MLNQVPIYMWLFRGVIFVAVLWMSYLIYDYLKKTRVIEESIDKVYMKTVNNERERIKKEQRIRYELGNHEKKGLFYQMDKMILQSNIRAYLPFMNTEFFLATVLGTSFLFASTVDAVTREFLYGLMAFVLWGMICFLIIYVMAGINYKKTEENITNFVNLLQNYSKTTDDINFIFSNIANYVDEPLKTALQETNTEIKSTGNLCTALENLQKKIEHEKFVEIIRNIEICSRYTANYAEIIDESRNSLRMYIKNKKERKEIIANGRIEILIIMLCSILVLYMMNGFTETNIIALLTSNIIGKMLILYMFIVLCVSIYTMFSIDK